MLFIATVEVISDLAITRVVFRQVGVQEKYWDRSTVMSPDFVLPRPDANSPASHVDIYQRACRLKDMLR